jgi:acetyl esterase/lipase
MIDAIFLGVGIVAIGLGLLNLFKSPDWMAWIIAVAATQYGYGLALICLAGAAAVVVLPGRGSIAGVAALAANAAGIALLLRPVAMARGIARTLPGKLAGQFGPARPPGPAFSVAGLFRGGPVPVPTTTWTFSGSLKLDFYEAAGRAPAPCVIVIHGGGWDNGDRLQIAHFNHLLARSGYAVAAVSYRLAPGAVWPAQREDVLAAVAFVKAHAGAWGVDPSRLVFLGRSAGGQIAEACAYFNDDPAVRGVIALYAPADMHFAWAWARDDDVLKSPVLLRNFLGGTPETAPAAYDSSSGYLLARPGVPPTLLVHGVIDTLVWHRQSERLSARLAEFGVPNLLVSVPWATHGLEYNLGSPSGQLTAYSVLWFLEATCR